ncbi:MAG: histidine kinase [Sphingobacteriaceae bacterium]|nr:histidine kinase [Sphingobacteriaceae bacterium]
MNITQKIFLHTIIWLAILIFFVFLGSRDGDYHEAIIIFVYFGVFNITIFYLNYLYILPKYLSKRRYWLCTLCIILLILLSGLLKYGFAYLFEEVILLRKGEPIPFSEYYLGAIFTGLFFIFLSTAFKFAVDWFLNEKVRKNLESEKLIAELAFLRSQINPHFLFNSLNNIYSLAYQKSDKAPEAIMKLSEIMRYMLQESNEPRVKLSREIRYLENYIELQKLRFKGQAYIELGITGQYGEQSIAPLILISFVENAFKHGVASDPAEPIKINIDIQKQHLLFDIWNKKSLLNKDESSGIGLSNVKRRLDLLYDGKYILTIDEGADSYFCRLSLNF